MKSKKTVTHAKKVVHAPVKHKEEKKEEVKEVVREVEVRELPSPVVERVVFPDPPGPGTLGTNDEKNEGTNNQTL